MTLNVFKVRLDTIEFDSVALWVKQCLIIEKIEKSRS